MQDATWDTCLQSSNELVACRRLAGWPMTSLGMRGIHEEGALGQGRDRDGSGAEASSSASKERATLDRLLCTVQRARGRRWGPLTGQELVFRQGPNTVCSAPEQGNAEVGHSVDDCAGLGVPRVISPQALLYTGRHCVIRLMHYAVPYSLVPLVPSCLVNLTRCVPASGIGRGSEAILASSKHRNKAASPVLQHPLSCLCRLHSPYQHESTHSNTHSNTLYARPFHRDTRRAKDSPAVIRDLWNRGVGKVQFCHSACFWLSYSLIF